MKYEDVAMHFNDLLIKLRMQALAVVAALSTIVSVFTRTSTNDVTWEIAAFVFAGLICFWVAMWILDFGYYNRLLIGAVMAIANLEEKSKTAKRIDRIELSDLIGKAVQGNSPRSLKPTWGMWSFYAVVTAALASGLTFSVWSHFHPGS
jgi:hypothetical protein